MDHHRCNVVILLDSHSHTLSSLVYLLSPMLRSVPIARMSSHPPVVPWSVPQTLKTLLGTISTISQFFYFSFSNNLSRRARGSGGSEAVGKRNVKRRLDISLSSSSRSSIWLDLSPIRVLITRPWVGHRFLQSWCDVGTKEGGRLCWPAGSWPVSLWFTLQKWSS